MGATYTIQRLCQFLSISLSMNVILQPRYGANHHECTLLWTGKTDGIALRLVAMATLAPENDQLNQALLQIVQDESHVDCISQNQTLKGLFPDPFALQIVRARLAIRIGSVCNLDFDHVSGDITIHDLMEDVVRNRIAPYLNE